MPSSDPPDESADASNDEASQASGEAQADAARPAAKDQGTETTSGPSGATSATPDDSAADDSAADDSAADDEDESLTTASRVDSERVDGREGGSQRAAWILALSVAVFLAAFFLRRHLAEREDDALPVGPTPPAKADAGARRPLDAAAASHPANESGWAVIDLPTKSDLFGIAHGPIPEELFAVGDAGTIVHWGFDATGERGEWTVEASGVKSVLRTVVATKIGEVYAAGDDGVLLRREIPKGTTAPRWAPEASGASGAIHALAAGFAGEVAAVGDEGFFAIRRLNTQTGKWIWQREDTGTSKALHAVAFAPSGAMIAAGEGGVVRERVPGKDPRWVAVDGTGEKTLFGAAVRPNGDWVLVGDGGGVVLGIESGDGGRTIQIDRSGDKSFRSLAVDAHVIAAVGDGGALVRGYHAGWLTDTSPKKATWYGVALAQGRIMVVGEGGAMAFRKR